MTDAERTSLIHLVSHAGDYYGYGPDGLLTLMDECNCTSTKEVTDAQLIVFCERHGLRMNPEHE